MKKWFLLIMIFGVLILPESTFGYKITTVSGYNNGYYNGYGGYGYPPPPPPPQLAPRVPYNSSTYYNYYNRMYPPVTPLISKSYKGTRMVMPYGYSTYYTPASVRNYGATTVKQYYTPSSYKNATGNVIRYYY